MSIVTNEYLAIFKNLKDRIILSQQKAIVSVNKEMILLYWEIGNEVLINQKREGWGTKIIELLSKDLKKEFPDSKGFSERNLKYMRKFAETYPNRVFVQEVLAQLTWYHNITIFEKIKNETTRNWYIESCIENGWSRNVLVHQIESELYERQISGNKSTNFAQTLPKPQSELAEQTLKDPYIFDFLILEKEAKEREIEKELIKHITKFLLELGNGFAFIGNQYKVQVSEKEYFLDLLFYHTKLKCYIAIELKTGEFKPEYAGKINFYLSIIDDFVKDKEDKPSIGIILCTKNDKIIAEYSLRDMTKPIGISEYHLTKAIPEEYKSKLPTVEELENELEETFKTESD